MTEEQLQHHVQQDDYFGTLATIVDLVRQDAQKHGFKPHSARALAGARDQVVLLQANFRLIKKVPE
jgi:hypothetical protein